MSENASSKHLFLLRPAAGTGFDRFAGEIPAALGAAVAGCGAAEATLYLTEEPPPRLTPIPYLKEPLALLAARGTEASLTAVQEKLGALPGTLQGWRVDESIHRERTRTWAAGERAPGACLLTFFRKNPRLSREQFFHEWYEHHTPLALKVHPLARYVRNAVAAPLVPGSAAWDGIVTESFDRREVLLSSMRLFGGPVRALPNMVRVGLHVSKFLDFPTIENAFVTERSLPV